MVHNQTGIFVFYNDLHRSALPRVLIAVRTEGAWPNALMLGPNDQLESQWSVTSDGGATIDLAVVCDSRAPYFAQQRVSAELANIPFKARFLDTTTAANLRECINLAL